MLFRSLELSGISKADLNIHVNRELNIGQSSATELDLEGMAYRLIHEGSGASRFDADDLIVHNALIKGSGAVNVSTNVTDSLDVRMSGASQYKNRYRPTYHHQEIS